MALYLIRRDVENAGQEDVDAAAIRALSCAFNYEGLRWVSSYWDRAEGRLFCIYEAENEQQIIDHSAQARLPCDQIRPVQQIDPDAYHAAVSTRVNA
jgi:hypothetical protein